MKLAFKEMRSDLDRSVNFIADYGSGFLEARYVRRTDDYFICYVSSHSGCKLACRFCHLTRTRQTSFDEADKDSLIAQIRRVLDYHADNETASPKMNVNFMARGEPLLNKAVTEELADIHEVVMPWAESHGISEIVYNPSSIFPLGTEELDLADAFGGLPVTPFWSLYSLDDRFRKRWLPKSIEPELALAKLLDFQSATGREVVLHWALISGENDKDEDFEKIAGFIEKSGLEARLNMVRYNPADEGTGVEADEDRYQAALNIIGEVMKRPGSRVVPRVGFDVKASCGMFVNKDGIGV